MPGEMPSVMHGFGRQPSVKLGRSSFDLSRGRKFTFDGGLLIPFFVGEALPGDSWNVMGQFFARMATPTTAFMDNVYFDVQWFAIPYRLVWDNWEKFNGAQDNPGDSTAFVTPKVTPAAGGYLEHSMGDYMGLPTKVGGAGSARPMAHQAMPCRCYNLVYNEWYKDENLIDNAPVDTDDGPDTVADYKILRRGKAPDYFTSALPFAQKGTASQFPLTGVVPVTLNPTLGLQPVFRRVSDHAQQFAGGGQDDISYSAEIYSGIYGKATGVSQVYDPTEPSTGTSTLEADLTSAGSVITVNDLREAIAVQEFLETNARFGTRYIEVIHGRFGVVSSDARLQRSEYLGGGSERVNVHPVSQTSESGTTPQGNLAAFATVAGRNGFTKSFEEHCWILGICSARADLNYQQGAERMWFRDTLYDHYAPEFAHLGEQTILSQEIFVDGTADDADVFGYQERYGEYRYGTSYVAGLFRSNATGSLDFWHAAQEFGTRPVLDETFINDTPPFDRVIAVPAEPHFLCDMFLKIKCARPMPVYGIPRLGGRF